MLGVTFLAIALVRKFYRPQTRRKSTPEPRPLAKDMRDTASPASVEKRQQIARRLYKHAETLLQGDIEVRHLMTSSPVPVRPQASVAEARRVMEDQCLDYLLVCDADGKLQGLVSHYYLQCTSAKCVADVMLPKPLFVTSDALLSPTVTHMLNQGVSCVAVVEQDRAIGMITTMDIQLTLQAALQVLARSARENPNSEFPSATTA
jgi:CBS domain-containing protein